MNHSFFAYIFRMRHIARWALMRNTRTENVEEHSSAGGRRKGGVPVDIAIYTLGCKVNQVETQAMEREGGR